MFSYNSNSLCTFTTTIATRCTLTILQNIHSPTTMHTTHNTTTAHNHISNNIFTRGICLQINRLLHLYINFKH